MQRFTSNYTCAFYPLPLKNVYLALRFQKRLNKSLVLIHLLICALISELLPGKPLAILPCSPGATEVSKTATAMEGLTLNKSRTGEPGWHSSCSGHGSPAAWSGHTSRSLPRHTWLAGHMTQLVLALDPTRFVLKRYPQLIPRTRYSFPSFSLTMFWFPWSDDFSVLQERMTFHQ